MKRQSKNIYVAILLLAALIFSLLTIYAFGESERKGVSLSARSAVLYQPDLDIFIYSKNADARLPMASTTKIMTALIAIERCDLCELVAVDDSAIGTEGSSAYLRRGDVLTVEELVYALLLQSANDTAVALACHIGGDLEGFSALMNERAAALGLTNTHFTNPHGLDDSEHYTTARELSLIAAEAMKSPTFRRICSTYKKTFATEERVRNYFNHNKLLRTYDGCVGVKTGYTQRSGRCLVSAAERDGLCFIAVTLDAPSDWQDHRKMLDLGFDSLEKITLAKEFEYTYKIPVIGGKGDSIVAANAEGAEIITEKGEHIIRKEIRLCRYAIAPINRGDILGEVIFTLDGETKARVAILATETVGKREKTGIFGLFYR